ncbi:hypothetical protein ABOM_006397 [Aspergillus bombycis]|uniref:DUF6606 domain-containing protein n=1 Tax=Aspergillus bombycis TaxID=109264 RepID=A0A1F8A0P0_9EURO|nr:hypothetical protein ABOM_006397 [Aspergillus bombycis]OGM45290.1 hypothetical protein ABOM_006397 [Aspergillus bombycis]
MTTPEANRKLPIGVLEYLINHVFLPPRVPQQDDNDPSHERALVKVVIDALREFKCYVTTEWHSTTDLVIAMVQNLQSLLETNGFMSQEQLLASLKRLCTDGGVLLLHIRAQNCGLMISNNTNSILFEAFELLPPNKDVMATQGRLRRPFPGPALSMEVENFKDPNLQSVLAETLAKMSRQSAPGTRPKVKKADHWYDDERETSHPKMVTELFFNFLKPLCEQVEPPRFWKNTRSEVMCCGSQLPWRRSPLWLLLRVGIQHVFFCHRVSQEAHNGYKMFMAYFLTLILEKSYCKGVKCELLHIMQAKIARRLLKLGHYHDMDLTHIADVIRSTRKVLAKK